MHTARQLSADMFKVTMRGAPASPADLLPNWGPLDRIGVKSRLVVSLRLLLDGWVRR